ncbi:MAG: RagB/SusD family nutrient uptake outer membrane protein, partial [Chitinophagaceae bacterium]|nr:RagB/SusD family nutrient uptake outer membrane protein [Chitinophagaceae bacterium]
MKIWIIVTISILLASCNKYLEKSGDPTKRVPRTVRDVLLLLDQQIPSGPIDIASDQFFVTDPMFDIIDWSEPEIDLYTKWIPNWTGTFINDDFWKQPYKAVFNANICLETLAGAQVTTTNKADYERALGAAYFERAFAFTTIAWQFAKAYNEATAKTDLGVVIDLHSEVTEKLNRSSVEETYAQIISDLENSLKHLPETGDHPLRPSQMAARGLLARVYLSMRKYDKALEQCNFVLQKRNELLDFNNPADVNIGYVYPMQLQRYGKEMIYNKQSYTPPNYTGNLFYFPVDSNLVKSYAVNDLRKTAWFQYGTFVADEFARFYGSPEGRPIMSGICVDEIYLIRAECYARANEVGKAMKDLNDLLVTRWKSGTYIPFTASTKEEALEIILEERRK